jgi:pimeloyl-ACP methyl ester carboxylesterase
VILIPIFKQNGLQINYLTDGTAKGETLVLVHGFGSKLQGWHYQIEFFKDCMKVIAMDNRGVGKSSRPDYPYTMEMFVEDLDHLLTYLEIDEKIHLCGISMGGMIVQNYALKFPKKLKTLILCATTERLEEGFYKMIDGLKEMESLTAEEKIINLLPFLVSRKFQRKIKEDKQLFDKIKSDMVPISHINNPPRIKDYENQAHAIEDHNTSQLLRELKMPTLILGASKDRLIPLHHQKSLHKKIPNSKLEVIEGAGHAFIMEQPDYVNKIMWNFIKEYS